MNEKFMPNNVWTEMVHNGANGIRRLGNAMNVVREKLAKIARTAWMEGGSGSFSALRQGVKGMRRVRTLERKRLVLCGSCRRRWEYF